MTARMPAYRRARPLLGTFVEIAASGPDTRAVPAAVEAAFAAVARVHALMSYQDLQSDVTRINRAAARCPVMVDTQTWRVLAAARDLAQASEGLFDVTIAPTLTRFGLLPRQPDMPRASGASNWTHVELLDGARVRLARPLRIDLSGIAKGYAVDCAVEALRQAGMTAGLVNAGGDLRAFGAHEQPVHLRRPDAPGATWPLLRLREGACATSAAYFATRRHRGRPVCPLVHPPTRDACAANRSVTVLAPDCMTADALTKVVHADPARAPAVLARYAARALLIERDEAAGADRFFTFAPADSGWQAL